MKRSLFLLGVAGAVVALTSLRLGTPRHARLRSGLIAGGCANHRRKLRWSGYTAADFS